ncbi:MAG: AtpZ/AtpI family protein, partial [Chloroflexota bacterium]
MNDDRGPWYLLTGLVIGVALGLFYAWKSAPVEYKDTHPSMLREEYKD